jgi:hypothetical protein
MLKDRFLHRSDVDLEENFSEEEAEENETEKGKGNIFIQRLPLMAFCSNVMTRVHRKRRRL